MILRLDHASYTYEKDAHGTKKFAVRDVSFGISKGEFLAVIGHTGSGKSTLIQLLNGLLMPTDGKVYFEDRDISSADFSLKELRRKVGLVFQYPEHQLFEMTVLKDICYGPKNLGLSPEEQKEAARRAMKMIGLSEEYEEKSPFELSGGEKRRVAIAGVLAMDPDVLVLDEPTAGLDPLGREEILNTCRQINREEGKTIVLVSHSMDDVAEYASRVLVLSNGELLYDENPRELFMKQEELRALGLSAPEVVYIMEDLRKAGLSVRTDVLTVQEAKEEILRALSNDS